MVVTQSLATGMTVLRNTMFTRVHDDVQRAFGMDSMLAPVSEEKSQRHAEIEIELFQIAQSVDEVKRSGYAAIDDDWYLNWLARLRLGEHWRNIRKAAMLLSHYLDLDSDDRRLAFASNLARTFPEAGRAPLVLYPLFPLAVSIVTATAFQDSLRAAELRNDQLSYLPAIADCPHCHGRPLDNEDQCQPCGNPLWTYQWLQAD